MTSVEVQVRARHAFTFGNGVSLSGMDYVTLREKFSRSVYFRHCCFWQVSAKYLSTSEEKRAHLWTSPSASATEGSSSLASFEEQFQEDQLKFSAASSEIAVMHVPKKPKIKKPQWKVTTLRIKLQGLSQLFEPD